MTIDLDLQLAVERELDNTVAKYNPEHALAIAMDPNTGEVLAMASRPNYNPNSYQTYTQEVLSRNLPIWMTYEPGSTMKITTLAASLNENIVYLRIDFMMQDMLMLMGRLSTVGRLAVMGIKVI